MNLAKITSAAKAASERVVAYCRSRFRSSFMISLVYGRRREKVTDYFLQAIFPANASGAEKPDSNAQINAFPKNNHCAAVKIE